MNANLPIEVTMENIISLCDYLSAGLPRRLAANGIALTEEHLHIWIAENPHREAILGAAEAKFQLRCIEALLSPKQSAASLRAIMWLLESRFPDQYGKNKAQKPAQKPLQAPSAAPATPVPAPAQTATPSAPEPDNIVEAAPFRNPHSEIRNFRNSPAPGRNDRCPCASGLKYKHCCGATNPRARRAIQIAPDDECLKAA